VQWGQVPAYAAAAQAALGPSGFDLLADRIRGLARDALVT